MTLRELREKKADKTKRMRAIADAAAVENRDLTEAEETEFAALDTDVDKLTTQIAREEKLTGREAEISAVLPAAGQHHRPGVVRAQGDPAKREFENLGEFCAAVAFNPNDVRLANLYNADVGAAQEGERAEQRMDSGPSGGFMVPEQLRPGIMQVDPQGSIIRPRATVIPAGTPPDSAVTVTALDQTGTAAQGNMYGGVIVNWIAEGGVKPETDAKLREIKLEPQEVAAHIVVTDKLLRNWAAASGFLETQLRGAINAAEDYAFLRGSGVGKPLGFLDAPASYVVTRAAAGLIKYADIVEMISRIKMVGGTPGWIASRGVLPQLAQLKNEIGSPPTGDGALIWQPNARDAAGNQLLMGYPINWNERSPALGAKGDVILTDLTGYLIKDGSGPFVAASSHVKFLENKTVIKIFWNVDGQPWLTEPINGEDDRKTSPFVVLNA